MTDAKRQSLVQVLGDAERICSRAEIALKRARETLAETEKRHAAAIEEEKAAALAFDIARINVRNAKARYENETGIEGQAATRLTKPVKSNGNGVNGGNGAVE